MVLSYGVGLVGWGGLGWAGRGSTDEKVHTLQLNRRGPK